jgi:sugar transferase (PEP-CTERM/EpsH1 system associated)
MKDLLFLVHRIPFPPNKGDKIRSWNILAHLASRYRVHVGAFIDDPHDWQYTGRIEAIATSTFFRKLDPRIGKVRSFRSLLTGEPLSCGYYRDRAMQSWVARTVRENRIERVFVYSSSMAQYIPAGLEPGARVVVDFVDIDSDKWRQYAERKSWPMSYIYRREARTLFEVEKEITSSVDASAFVSGDEADLFRKMAPTESENVHGIANGVDCDFFDPEVRSDAPYPTDRTNIVFTGAMDYWANVDAAIWFADDILPRIRAALPECTFWIVGANPTPEIVKLGDRDGISVTGRVTDVRPFIRHASISVAPLRVARGIQNKVLEAMALAKTVVATPQAMEGIAAIDGSEVFVAETAGAFADRVEKLANSPDLEAIGSRARQRVLVSYGWLANLQKFEGILEGTPSGDKLDAITRD